MALSDKKGTRFAARSEEWDDEQQAWRTKYTIGDVEEVPSISGAGKEGFQHEETWSEGSKVIVLGAEYTVRALEGL